jgi:hypothetical protein
MEIMGKQASRRRVRRPKGRLPLSGTAAIIVRRALSHSLPDWGVGRNGVRPRGGGRHPRRFREKAWKQPPPLF